MSYITTFEELDEKIKATGGMPTVLEALWDGDTNGWFLILSLYAKTGNVFWGSEECHHLGVARYNKQPGIFKDDVPRWPEAALVRDWGQKAIEKYGLTFYFPSDKEPDDNCPPWTEKHYGFPCADCGKLIRLRYSEYVPHDICNSCNSKREWKESLRRNDTYKDAVFGTYVTNDNSKEQRDVNLVHYLHGLSGRKGNVQGDMGFITFNNYELIELKNKHYEEIKTALSNYIPSNFTGEKRKFGSFTLVEFEGREYELETTFSRDHSDIYYLLHRYKAFEQAANEGWTYYLHIIKAISYRADSVLRFIYFVAKGSTTIKAIKENYADALSEDEVMDTLKKLEGLECVEVEGNVVRITAVGQGCL